MEINQSGESALQYARRVVGMAAQGVLCSPTVANNALRQLTRELGPEALQEMLPKSAELLNALGSHQVLPTEKQARGAMEEIKTVYAQIRQNPRDMMGHDETPLPAPGN